MKGGRVFGARDHGAAAAAEQEHERCHRAVSRRGAEPEEGQRNQTEAEQQADFLALRVHEGTDEEPAHHQSDGLRHRDVSVLFGR